ncbi:AAA family ATPase [candidate division KSB1 bacterium]|nr:MAG: AAA family ATPase [candidate division KSB1 bacterium]MBC6950210.1 AAA family ATPase [candidate division KSB1 bacterium]MCE7941572.1 AAA family ATPase [Chlorobi bacterium CHB1]
MKSLFLQRPAVLDSPVSPSPRAGGSYENAHAHLLDELRWLNRILFAHVLRLRQVNFYDSIKDLRGFFTADEEIDALFAAEVLDDAPKNNGRPAQQHVERLLQQAKQLRAEIEVRLQATSAQHRLLPLVQLANCFQLNTFEQQAVLICLAPQIDARYEKIYAYLQNDLTKKCASIDLILNLLCQTAADRLQNLKYFTHAAPLRRFDLLEPGENDSAYSAAHRSLRAATRIVHYALDVHVVEERIANEVEFLSPLAWEKVVVNDHLRQRLQTLLTAKAENDGPTRRTLYFHGRAGAGKKTLARALCGDHGIPLLVADMRVLLTHPETFQEKLRLILREGLLQSCAIYFGHIEKLTQNAEEPAPLLMAFMQGIVELGWITFLGSELPMPSALLDLPGMLSIDIPSPDPAEQQALWRLHLNGSFEAGDLQPLEELTTRFDLNGGQIAGAVQLATQAGRLANPAGTPLTLRDLFRSSRIQSQPRLSALARKIEPKYAWQDLVLPEDQMQQLREIADQVKFRHVVLHDWGFAGKLSLGRGLNALFAGPSGTGKTMAAEVIANELGLDLYKIDLSAVVSKYIGETEKNLNRVFTEAEHSNAILFFDEADALLGKRSEVKDAHDRYANIEIAYLLQKMEEYEGLVILATNLKKNMDDAFVRRLQFVVDLPFPDEKYRHRIWSAIFPSSTPLSEEIDFKLLAKKLKITGGNIKNIGLKAAYLAAAEGGAVRMQHVVRATKREFQKMGKLYVESDFYREGKVLD